MTEFEQEIASKLLGNGEVEIRGLQVDAMCDFCDRLLESSPNVWGFVVYEAAAKNGFFRDTTNAHVVARGATFMPCFQGHYYLVTRNDEDFADICELERLEVKPATKEEMEELAKILKS